jgi:hypothetical protein
VLAEFAVARLKWWDRAATAIGEISPDTIPRFCHILTISGRLVDLRSIRKPDRKAFERELRPAMRELARFPMKGGVLFWTELPNSHRNHLPKLHPLLFQMAESDHLLGAGE